MGGGQRIWRSVFVTFDQLTGFFSVLASDCRTLGFIWRGFAYLKGCRQGTPAHRVVTEFERCIFENLFQVAGSSPVLPSIRVLRIPAEKKEIDSFRRHSGAFPRQSGLQGGTRIGKPARVFPSRGRPGTISKRADFEIFERRRKTVARRSFPGTVQGSEPVW